MDESRLVEMIEDFKQYVAVTVSAAVSQSESRLEARLEAKLGGRIDSLEARLTNRIDKLEHNMNDGFATIGDIITAHNDQLDNHENRLRLLERRVV